MGKITESFREVLLMGSGDEEIEFNFRRNGKPTLKPFEGVVPNLERLMQETDSEFTKTGEKLHEQSALRRLSWRTSASGGFGVHIGWGEGQAVSASVGWWAPTQGGHSRIVHHGSLQVVS